MLKTILVAITNDNKKDLVLKTAIDLSKSYQAKLVITHVNQIVLPQTGTLGYSHATPITIDSISDNEMEELEKIALEAGVKEVEGKVAEGLDVSSVVTTELFDLYNPDLIIAGDNKHHSLIEKMMGSTANGIVKNARCSVYIVK